MRYSHGRRRRALGPATWILLAACAGRGTGPAGNGWVEIDPASQSTEPVVNISGTVRHLDLEGGLFVIQDAAGTRYNPTNLPEAFRVDGKAVEAEARRRDDVVSIGMVGPMVELVRIRERAPDGAAAALGLEGTRWLLEDLAGTGVLDNVRATLEFSAAGRVTGNGSCNRFTGMVTVTGDVLTFGPLATTRMACPEAVMNQESRYLEALREAQRFEIKEPFLYIHAAGAAQPLRFVRE